MRGTIPKSPKRASFWSYRRNLQRGVPSAIMTPRARRTRPNAYDMTALTRSGTRTFYPYKGEASYFSIPAGGEHSNDAIWTYEAPFDAVAEIENYLAFYPDRVDAIEERDASRRLAC